MVLRFVPFKKLIIEEKEVTINTAHVEYETANNITTLIVRSADYVKIWLQVSQMDGTILVCAAAVVYTANKSIFYLLDK